MGSQKTILWLVLALKKKRQRVSFGEAGSS